MTVARKALGALSNKLGEGAVGAVYRTDYRLSSFAGPLAYKELSSDLSDDERRHALRTMKQAVALRRSLNGSDRMLLDEYTAWPLDMVTDGGREVGCLMPLIPPDFFANVVVDGKADTIPRNIEFLSATEKFVRRAGFDQNQIDEFSDLVSIAAVLAKVVYAIAVLHKHGIVYGDVSLKNAVFALNPPRVMLLDCDSVAPLADSQRRHMNSPFFDAPEFMAPGTHPFARGNPHRQDFQTDVYKLACLVIRALSRGPGATQLKTAEHLKGELDARTLDTIRNALGADPSRRPSAKRLYGALARFVRAKSAPPEIKEFYPVSTVIPRGTDVEFICEVEGTVNGRLIDPLGQAQVVPLARGRFSVSPVLGGVHWLEVSTKSYTVRRASVPIHVFDVPDFQLKLDSLPQLSAPDPPPIPEGVLRPLPSSPQVSVVNSFNPEIGIKDLDLVLGEVAARLTMSMNGGPAGQGSAPHPRSAPQLSDVTASLLRRAEALNTPADTAQGALTQGLREIAETKLETHIHSVLKKLTADFDDDEV